jgi:hypothetical protein
VAEKIARKILSSLRDLLIYFHFTRS